MPKKNNNILIIDDDPVVLESINKVLTLLDYKVTTRSSPEHLELLISNHNIATLILDVMIPGYDGMIILKEHIQNNPHIPVIMISGQSTINIAVKALKSGAYDFVEKPIDPDRLINLTKNAVQKYQDAQAYEELLNKIKSSTAIIGESAPIKKIMSDIHILSRTEAKVLILGETGTGKELVARAIHYNSNRADKPFIKVNCAAIPGELLESELFGHKRGSFTGAFQDKKGKFALADGGSILLDEIGDMPFQLQTKILRVLQDGVIEVLGSAESKQIDVRVLAATNKNLQKLISKREFREDLYHRLNVGQIYIPPLRHRKEDIDILMVHFVQQFCEEYNKPLLKFDSMVFDLLKTHLWPGNIRELKNLAEKMVIYSDGKQITNQFVQQLLHPPHQNAEELEGLTSIKKAHDEFEKKYIIKILNENDWNINKTARLLEIDRSNLYKKIRRHGIGR